MDLSIEYYKRFLPSRIKTIPKFSSSYLRKVLFHLRKIGMASYKRIIVVDWKRIGVKFCYIIVTLSDFKPENYDAIIMFLNDNKEFIEANEHMDGDIIFVIKMCYKNISRRDFLVRLMSEMNGIKSIQSLDVIDYEIKAPFPLIN